MFDPFVLASRIANSLVFLALSESKQAATGFGHIDLRRIEIGIVEH